MVALAQGDATAAGMEDQEVIWWLIIALVLIVVGAALWTQGAGPGVAYVGGIIVLILLIGQARAHDSGQWEATNPAIKEWYQSLMQPDNPNASCCGEADAYWADEIHVRDGKTYATVTDDRPDVPRGRPHVDIGTEVEIPNHKLKWDRSNPTGHGVVFLSRAGYVYCFVQPTGI